MAPDDPADPGMYDPGLSYTTVAQTNLSRLDAEAGELYVGGYSIEELAANASYEEAVWLLFEGRLPTADELQSFRDELADLRPIPEPVRELLRAGVESTEPMDALRMGLAAVDLHGDIDDPLTAATRVVAVVPTIVATHWRLSRDEPVVEPDADLGHVANYLWMLTGERPTSERVDALETCCVTLTMFQQCSATERTMDRWRVSATRYTRRETRGPRCSRRRSNRPPQKPPLRLSRQLTVWTRPLRTFSSPRQKARNSAPR